jgi:AAA+ superfamily predicted ATPase
VLHGNVHDLLPCPEGNTISYYNLPEFLTRQLFGTWDLVLHYDLGRGLRPLSGGNPQRLAAMIEQLGSVSDWPRDPEGVLLWLDRLIERNLLEEDLSRRRRLAVILEFAQYLVPGGSIESLARGQGATLVRFLGWAQNPYIKRANMAFCLVADRLPEVNERLVQSPHVGTIEIPLPGTEQRRDFCRWAAGAGAPAAAANLNADELAELSTGLSLVNLNVLLAQGQPVDSGRFRTLKKKLIERQCQDLIEFVPPGPTLDLVVGHDTAKERLRQDAELITQGRLGAAPMGYLLCGPVGTGKSFLAECYAGSIGIPCVKLRNFRSKYVGETEANLEHVLRVLRSLGPVVVLIDEADAALGSRRAEGDSGTSSRVFAMIASQMGDTRYRGRIVWMLLTSRPDLLPVDLKRQGRAEVHIPLFYPDDEAEVREMFLAMARKNKIGLVEAALPPIKAERHLSGSDIESIVLAARRRALAAGREDLLSEDLQTAVSEFIPSAQGLEKEMQELAAVLECTQRSFLPSDWQKRVTAPEGRARLQERFAALKQLVED